MQEDECVHEILPLLRCVECGYSVLEIVSEDRPQWSGYLFDPSTIALSCNQCGTRYPITDDGIPVLWTSQLKKLLRKKASKNNLFDQQGGQKGGQAALYSNISSYDRMSDDYAVNWRRDSTLIRRMKAGAARLAKAVLRDGNCSSGLYHLDVGCGPGHVLEWLKSKCYRQVGLDVSLNNLRNARKSTGAAVVLADGKAMPFNNDVFGLVTGSAVLHHIFDWKRAIVESCRVCCKTGGGIMYDSEPTVESLSLSQLACLVFDLRWPAYKFLSYLDPKKGHFRNTSLAKEYYRSAEIHNQPGRGISVSEVREVFLSSEFDVEIFLSPGEELQVREKVGWKEAGWKRIVLHLLSGHNPLLSKYGSFTVLAFPGHQSFPQMADGEASK